MDKQIACLYEIKRQSLLLGFVQNPERVSQSLAFACYNRLAPILNEDIMRESYGGEDPFSDAYAVKAEFINNVIEYIDECVRDEQFDSIKFYNLEDKFGQHRMELKHCVEYFRIDGRFDDQTYEAIERHAPSEARSIASNFTPEDVHFN